MESELPERKVVRENGRDSVILWWVMGVYVTTRFATRPVLKRADYFEACRPDLQPGPLYSWLARSSAWPDTTV